MEQQKLSTCLFHYEFVYRCISLSTQNMRLFHSITYMKSWRVYMWRQQIDIDGNAKKLHVSLLIMNGLTYMFFKTKSLKLFVKFNKGFFFVVLFTVTQFRSHGISNPSLSSYLLSLESSSGNRWRFLEYHTPCFFHIQPFPNANVLTLTVLRSETKPETWKKLLLFVNAFLA